MIRTALRLTATLVFAVILASRWSAAAQAPEAPPKSGASHHKPQDNSGKPAAKKTDPQTWPAQSPASAGANASPTGADLDFEYGAYQRGHA